MTTLFIALEGLTSLARLPSLAGFTCQPLHFPLADARIASLVTAMTGTWPDQHGILTAETSDDLSTLRLTTAADRAWPTFWETLDANNIPCISVGWPLAITGSTTRSAIVEGTRVHPSSLEPALADCWLRSDELDTDTLAALVPLWQQVNQSVDNRLATVGEVLADNVSRHAAFLELLDTQPWQCATLCLSLVADMRSLERASEPLADDVLLGLTDRSLDLLDAFLAEILRRAPEDCNVVIAGLPHAETPATPGFVISSSPAITSLLDLTPLICRLAGTVVQVTRLHSPNHTRLLKVSAPLLKKPGESLTELELWHYNALHVLGCSLAARDECLPAYAVLEASTRLAPNDIEAKLRLIVCQKRLGLLDEALDTAYAAEHPQFRADPGPLLAAAELEARLGRPEAARRLLQRTAPYLEAAAHRRPMHIAALIALRDWSAAIKVLKADEHLLLARCHLGLHQWQAAFDSAIASTQLDPNNARAHELLGHALHGMGLPNQAWQAFEAATQARPQWPRPWAKLVMLARQMHKPKDAIEHLIQHHRKLKHEATERRENWRRAVASERVE